MTYLEIARCTAAYHGLSITDAQADWDLWERTAFPFNDEVALRRQLHGLYAWTPASPNDGMG